MMFLADAATNGAFFSEAQQVATTVAVTAGVAVLATGTAALATRRSRQAGNQAARRSLGEAEERNEVPDQSAVLYAEYSGTVLSQAQTSYYVTIAASVLGFAAILAGIVVAIVSGSPASASLIPIISGAVLEGVAGLFYKINLDSRKTMESFHDKMRGDRRLDNAFKAVGKIENLQLADETFADLAMHSIGMPAKERPAITSTQLRRELPPSHNAMLAMQLEEDRARKREKQRQAAP